MDKVVLTINYLSGRDDHDGIHWRVTLGGGKVSRGRGSGIGRSGSSSNINSSLGGSGSSGRLCDTIPDAPLGPVDSQKPSKYYVSEFKDRDDKQVV